MSRFEEVVNDVIGEVVLSERVFRAETLATHIAEKVRDRQDARRAEVRIEARYPEHKPAPVSGIETQELYTLLGTAVASEAGTRRLIGVRAQGMTACPCAQGLVAGGRARAAAGRRVHRGGGRARSSRRSRSPPTTSAGSARSTSAARRTASPTSTPSGCCAIVEDSMSSEIYELMKRSDEGAVVEKAHRRPRFVEDCVREMVRGVIESLPGADRPPLRLRPPGEPGDDPPAQRGRRALRAARRAAARGRLRRALRASRLDARVARRPRVKQRAEVEEVVHA